MIRSKALVFLAQREGNGPEAQRGDRVLCNCCMFLNRADEVPINARQAVNLPAHRLRGEGVGCEGARPRSRNLYATLEITCNLIDQSVTCSEQKRKFPEGLSSFCVQADL